MNLFAKDPPIIVIDVANVAFRAAFAPAYSKLTTKTGKFSGHVFGAFSIIMGSIKTITKNKGKVILWYALEGFPKKRRELLPSYKANRNKKGVDPVPDVTRLVRLMPGSAWYGKNLEADDVIARLIARKNKNQRMVAITGDHDLWQFQNIIDIWDKHHVVSKVEVEACFGVSNPKSIPLIKALFGDKVDNIKPAAPRLQRKPILNLIRSKNITNLGAFFENVQNNGNMPEKIKNLIISNEEQIRLQFKLVKLRIKSKHQPNQISSPLTPGDLNRFLRSFDCKSLLKKTEELWSKVVSS